MQPQPISPVVPQPLSDGDEQMRRGDKRTIEDLPGPSRINRPKKEGTKRPYFSHSDSEDSSDHDTAIRRPEQRRRYDQSPLKFLNDDKQRMRPTNTPDSSDIEGVSNIRQHFINVQISKDSIIPRESSYCSPAYDICSRKKVTIPQWSVARIDIGMKIKIPAIHI